MFGWLVDALEALSAFVSGLRAKRRIEILRAQGLRVGTDVKLPASTWIDSAHSYLISIGDHCGFGEQCLILSHDAQMDEFLDAGRLGRVTIHAWCQFGSRTTIMPGVEVGPRTIVTPGSVVLRTLPADTVCGGNPARMLGTLEQYLAERRVEMEQLPRFDREAFERMSGTPEGRAALAAAVALSGCYVSEGGALGSVPTSVARR